MAKVTFESDATFPRGSDELSRTPSSSSSSLLTPSRPSTLEAYDLARVASCSRGKVPTNVLMWSTSCPPANCQPANCSCADSSSVNMSGMAHEITTSVNVLLLRRARGSLHSLSWEPVVASLRELLRCITTGTTALCRWSVLARTWRCNVTGTSTMLSLYWTCGFSMVFCTSDSKAPVTASQRAQPPPHQ